MRDVLVKIPFFGKDIPINGYGVMIVAGFILATVVAARDARRRGLPDFTYDMGIAMLLCGIAGGRIFYYIQFYDEQFASRSLWAIFKIWEGGLVFYGGAAGGLVGGLLYLTIKKLPLGDCLDVASLVCPIGMGIGRFGCFLHGCCFGRVCSPAAPWPLAVVFPPEAPVYQHHLAMGWIEAGAAEPLAVHPVQVYQAGHDLLLFGILFLFLRLPSTPRAAGMPLLFVLYGIGRFFMEELRGDHTRTGSEFTVSQIASMGLLAVGLTALILLYSKNLKSNSATP